MSGLTDQLNTEDVHRVVQHFYLQARQHPVIGHHFAGIDDFRSHEEKITAFWWLALGGTVAELANGAPAIDMINKHIALGINAKDLELWLGLFEQTLDEEIQSTLASAWKVKLREIAAHLKKLAIDKEAGGIQIKEAEK
ncbi:MAG: group III truncated hemoglobin [Gammaproteobacteria bacterium]|nr:group III truncated hemoglobin [Gammaproteobacteria bacterium]